MGLLELPIFNCVVIAGNAVIQGNHGNVGIATGILVNVGNVLNAGIVCQVEHIYSS